MGVGLCHPDPVINRPTAQVRRRNQVVLTGRGPLVSPCALEDGRDGLVHALVGTAEDHSLIMVGGCDLGRLSIQPLSTLVGRPALRGAAMANTSATDFQKAIRPAVEGGANCRSACTGVLDRHNRKPGVPRRCPAMTELQHQSAYRGTKENQPVDNVMSMITLLADAGNDALRALVVLANTEPVFIWAHLPPARAALEAFAYCRWLAECPLDPDRRVQRGLLMQLEDAKELARFGNDTFTKQSQQTKASIRAFSDANEWPV